MLKHLHRKMPPFVWTPKSMVTWAGYLFSLAILSALVQIVLQFVIGLLAIGAVVCLLAAIVLKISKRGK